jgi:hypothetical protein
LASAGSAARPFIPRMSAAKSPTAWNRRRVVIKDKGSDRTNAVVSGTGRTQPATSLRRFASFLKLISERLRFVYESRDLGGVPLRPPVKLARAGMPTPSGLRGVPSRQCRHKSARIPPVRRSRGATAVPLAGTPCLRARVDMPASLDQCASRQ